MKRILVGVALLVVVAGALQAVPRFHLQRLLLEGDRCFLARDDAGALRRYEQCSRMDPSCPRVWHRLGMLALRQRRLEDAEAHLRRALQRDPGQLDSLFLLARCQILQRKPSQALSTLMRCLKQNPRSQEAFELLGWLETSRGNPERARFWFEKMLELNPHQDQAHYLLGNLAARQGRWQEAAEQFSQALGANAQRDAEALYRQGDSLLRAGRPQEAARAFERALASAPHPGAHLALGRMLARGDPRAAATHLREFLQIAPGDPRVEEVRLLLQELESKP